MFFDPRDGRKGIFANERDGLRRSSRLIVSCLCLTFLVVSSVWFLFVSGVFTVTQIEVKGIKALDQEVVASTTYQLIDAGAWKPWDKRNLFFIQPTTLAEDLQHQLFAEQVTVEKVYPNVLRLLISERQRSVVMVSKGQFLLVDVQGIVTAEADPATLERVQRLLSKNDLMSADQLPVIIHDLPEPATAGYQAAKPESVRAWIEASKTLLGARIRHRYLTVPDIDGTTMEVQTDGNINIVMERGSQMATQIEMYRKFMENKQKEVQVKEYIDVRVPGKVFVK